MKFDFCRIFPPAACLLILTTLLSVHDASGQRKRRGDDPQASGSRLREAEFYFTEGEKFFILEDYAKALEYYQKTLEIAPGNATVYYKVAEVLSRSNRQDDLMKAAAAAEQALSLEKKNKYFYLLAANIMTSLTQFDRAAEIYQQLVSEVKGTEEYLYELAAVYQYANKPEEAIKVYNRAEAVLGVNEISSVQKMRLYFEQGKTKEALAEGEKLVKAFPSEESYIGAFTEMLAQRGMRREAIQYLESFVSQNPDAGSTQMLLAGFYRDDNQEQKARPLLLALFDNADVEFGSKLIIMGAYNMELNQARATGTPDKEKEAFAMQLFTKLARLYPDEPNIHVIGGDLYLSSAKFQEARQEYLKAVASDEINFEVWENLLYLDIQLEQYDQAARHADQALELFPNQARLYYFSGYAQLRLRHHVGAIAALEQARRLSTGNAPFLAEINGMLGDAYNAIKSYEKSDAAYDEALNFNANNDVVLNNYSYFLAMRKANLDKAEKMAALLVKNSPDNTTYLDTYAWVLYARGKYKDARKVIERAVASGKATATHFEHYGDILYKLGEVDAAVQQWEKARGLNANSESLNKKIANRRIYE